MRFYGSLTKVDEEQRMVFGYASTEAVDAHGEIILRSAIEEALTDYMDFANIREMHQLSAVGTAEEASVDDKGLYLGAHIVDDPAWVKVTSGVYKGFSVGGKVLARDPDDKKIITKILLTEISLVDRPSNPEARFDVWKAAGSPQEDASMAVRKTKTATVVAPIQIPADAKSDVIAKAVNDAVASGTPVAVASEAQGQLLKAVNDKVVTVVAQAEELPLEPETVAKAVDPTADAAPVAEGEGDAVAKADAPAEGAVEVVAEADLVAKAEETEKPVDAITKATTALDAIDAAVATIVKPDDVNKGMYSVADFADALSYIAGLVAQAEWEKEIEGDGSKVPKKLREWLKTGAAIFKEMAKEEVDELVAGTKQAKAAAAEAISKAADADDLAKATADNEALSKALTEKDEALTKLAERIEPLAKTVADLVEANAELAKRFAAEPLPAKTAGNFVSVSKEQDAGGASSLEKATPSQDDIAAVLAEMSPDDRAMLLTKAALQMPRTVTYRPA